MPDAPERRGFWHEPDGTPTSKAIALQAWVTAAHEVLTEVAGDYHAVITEDELSGRVQTRAHVATSHPHRTWLPALLTPVVHLCHRADEPPLTALVVRTGDGRVGASYDDVLTVAEHRPITDPEARETHAAGARLECYQWAGSAPADGGVPARPTMATRARAARRASGGVTRTVTPRRPAKTDIPIVMCPTCFMALPSTGICDTCG
jgi:hypothetical protein